MPMLHDPSGRPLPMTFDEFLAHFPRRKKNSPTDYHVPCPGHDDNSQDPSKFSLHVTLAGDHILLKCFAGCDTTRALSAMTPPLTEAALFTNGHTSAHQQPPAAPDAPPTLALFAQRKVIPQARLEAEGWREGECIDANTKRRVPCLVIPYPARDGSTWRHQYRTSLRPGAGFQWDGQKDKPLIPYGRHRLDQIMEKGELWFVEGASDAITAWVHGLPCLAFPGNSTVKALAPEDLVGIETVWIVREPGQSGEGFVTQLRDRLAALGWTGAARVVTLPAKDLSDLHVLKPSEFWPAIRAAQAEAQDLAAWEPGDTASKPSASTVPITLAQLALRPPPEPAWLVDQLILEAANGWIGAGAKVGKSYLGLDLLLAGALGRPWLDHFAVLRPLTVVLVEEEDSAWRVYQRAMRLCAGRGVPMPDNFFVHIRTGLQLDTPATLDPFLRWLERTRADLVTWDVFNKLHTKNERAPEHMMPILRRVDRIRDELGISNLIAHHGRKPSPGGPDLATGGQKLRGLSEFHAWAENSLYLTALKGKGVLVVEPESKDAIVEPFKVHLEDLPDDGRRWVYDGVVQAREAQGAKTRQAIMEALATGPMTVAALADLIGKKERAVKSHLAALEKDGVVDFVKEPGRAGRRLWIPNTEPD